MNGKKAYLDSSVILKRYLLEDGSETAKTLFQNAYRGKLRIVFSFWNIGEVLGVFNRKFRRGEMDRREYDFLRNGFLGEVKRLSALDVLKIVPVHSILLAESWKLIEEHHLYQADALQVVSARHASVDEFYTSNKQLHKIALKEGLNSRLVG
ncbi:type II toxin-antitoxin system VapC family toxin [Palaeococcus sp. (in: euryarchaeotes)]